MRSVWVVGIIRHLFDPRLKYADQVAKKPGDVHLRLRYANTLRSQGWDAEAEEIDEQGINNSTSPILTRLVFLHLPNPFAGE